MGLPSGSTLQPLGFFIAPNQLGPPSPLLADNIDPVTKDWADLFSGADVVDDQVQITMMTNLGSGGSVQQTGIRLNRRKMGPDLKNLLEGDVRQALKRLADNRDIRVQSVTFGIDNGSGQPTGELDEANQTAQANVNYVNLRALDFRVRSLSLQSNPNIAVVG